MTVRCPICGRAFASLFGLRIHIYRCHVTYNRCPLCGRTFTFKGFINHIKNHKELKVIVR
ncbi:MAG: C2H2-type zinc finger protein [Candidatus Nezhaarchaeales archaeon]